MLRLGRVFLLWTAIACTQAVSIDMMVNSCPASRLAGSSYRGDRAPLGTVMPSSAEVANWDRAVRLLERTQKAYDTTLQNFLSNGYPQGVAERMAQAQADTVYREALQTGPPAPEFEEVYLEIKNSPEIRSWGPALWGLTKLVESREALRRHVMPDPRESRSFVNLGGSDPNTDFYPLYGPGALDGPRKHLTQLKNVATGPGVPPKLQRLLLKLVDEFEHSGWVPSHSLSFMVSELKDLEGVPN